MAGKINIGCVVYTETDTGLEAVWHYDNGEILESGTGIAKRLTPLNKDKIFEGEFVITYFDTDNEPIANLTLIIVFEKEYYKLSWLKDGELAFAGMGFFRDDQLVAGYSKVV